MVRLLRRNHSPTFRFAGDGPPGRPTTHSRRDGGETEQHQRRRLGEYHESKLPARETAARLESDLRIAGLKAESIVNPGAPVVRIRLAGNGVNEIQIHHIDQEIGRNRGKHHTHEAGDPVLA
jgi:hypothetical protein